jgi:SAM-dependent methyltransferase
VGLHTYTMSLFGNPDYVAWRRQRLDALRSFLGEDFLRGRRVLELGGGDGHMTVELLRLGARVVMVEARQGYVDSARVRCPDAWVVRHDLDGPLPRELLHTAERARGEAAGDRPFDVVFHSGLLYHLGDPMRSVREACSVADELVLETEVTDSFDPDQSTSFNESPGKEDDGVGPVGVRPSQAMVERELDACGFTHRVVPVADLEGSPHRYGWAATGDGRCGQALTRRMWHARRVTGRPRG